ncbi:MAG TPA: valine--tRNA ligase [Candidatus Micrarchaeia archaeon]|nr:valine--tRNA ligase [Candidatus Micrarchaeia archaeon]
MEKQFSARSEEQHWRGVWERLGIGHADPARSRPPFSMALPPPNITGRLHLGHATNGALQDALARFHRMGGEEVCWVPGTDHAAIATQNVIERQLAEEGTTKEAIGRAAFATRVDAWYEQVQGEILEQLRRLGTTCDWPRARFTLDDPYVHVIRRVFKELFDAGLIYRGPRIVNWCPRCGSAISDEEIDFREHHDTFYFVRYRAAQPGSAGGGSEAEPDGITVATARPETIPADVAVAVNPQDPRHAGLVGRSVLEPLTGRAIPVIADAMVRIDVGTGALKITPGHAPDDYEIGQRHGLPVVSVIDLAGRLRTPDLPELDGLTVAAGRERAAALLRRAGAMVREEPLVHMVGHCDRCGTVIEPLVTPQWWCRMAELAGPAAAAVRTGAIRFHPARFSDEYLGWLDGLRDWCVSRQLWLGHRIPVSTCDQGHGFSWVDEPHLCPTCGSTVLAHDPDVLDTWFSSALWPFAILGWPDATPEFRRFYPTSVLSTARGILRLWVARMVMTGLRFTGEVPFRDVLIHATVLAPDGQVMSKSRGNGVDPLEMVERHGADAVRAWAAQIAMGTQDTRFDERRIESWARFANKLWNMTRMLWDRLPRDGEDRILLGAEPERSGLELADRWILARTCAVLEGVTGAYRRYDLSDAIEALYEFSWHELADWYWELVKDRLATQPAAGWVAGSVLLATLAALHPIMPFVTDACASRFAGRAPTLDLAGWPALPATWRDPESVARMGQVLDVTRALRSALQESLGAARPRRRGPLATARLRRGPDAVASDPGRAYVARMAGVEWHLDEADGPGGHVLVAGASELVWHAIAEGGAGPDPAQAARDLERVEAHVAALAANLAGPFAERAPAGVVAAERAKLADAERRAEVLRASLAGGGNGDRPAGGGPGPVR